MTEHVDVIILDAEFSNKANSADTKSRAHPFQPGPSWVFLFLVDIYCMLFYNMHNILGDRLPELTRPDILAGLPSNSSSGA